MAEEPSCKDVELLKRTKISVFVDEAMPDILVVTYEFGVKIFKGVLLDSTKRNLPCGVPNLNPAFKTPSPTKSKLDDDTLYSVNQRFAYTDPNSTKKRNVQLPCKYKNSKMTVRLRPRKVLCSKCKGICNENSENVSLKRKKPAEHAPAAPPVKRGSNAPVTRSVTVYSELTNNNKRRGATLVPKLTRLTPQEELRALNGGRIIFNDDTKPLEALVNKENTEKQHSDQEHSTGDSKGVILSNFGQKSGRRTLRKKRSVGSMEDLWDESVFEENANKNINHNSSETSPEDSQTFCVPNSVSSNTRTIKISYGPQGEGTVLKIPAQIENLSLPDGALEEKTPEGVDEEEEHRDLSKNIVNKAARRALKKAKKEAKRRIILPNSSPCYLGNGSPRYTIGSASPRHGLGNNSPRYICTSYEFNMPRRRKHKVKHKKKHKEDKDRKHKEGEVSSTSTVDDAKEQCVTQKLSINLKRLNNTYTSLTGAPSAAERSEETGGSSSDEHSEKVPDFPAPNPPLMLHINSQSLPSVPTADGGRMLVGDVVWGKIHGFPWWPGKILTITNCGTQGPQAHVAWYGSSTSSWMQCDQLSPYLENFKIRYNKKKRGPYKEAIKRATLDARENAEMKMRQPLANSPSHNIMPQVVSPALASPREIDVVS